jgi:hypothetical protein
MTRYRVPFSVAVISVAVSAALDANAQLKSTGNAQVLNASSQVSQTCSGGYALTISGTGALDLKCEGSLTTPQGTSAPAQTPTEAGVISFTSASFTGPQNQPIALSLQRTARNGGNPGTGAISTLVDISRGPCTIYGSAGGQTSVTFAAGDVAPKTVTLAATAQGECAVRVVTGSADDRATAITSTFVAVTAPSGTPAPTPLPTPAPTSPPTGSCYNGTQTIPETSNIVMQTMYAGGTNNYVLDSRSYTNPVPGTQANGFPQATTVDNTVQVFPLPQTWPDGAPITAALLSFTDYIYFNLSGAQYEISLSKCKGDFSYYKTAQQYPIGNDTYQPCGGLFGATASVRWSNQGNFLTCQIPTGEQWYMNWRPVPGSCPTNFGHTCGQTFYVPRG